MTFHFVSFAGIEIQVRENVPCDRCGKVRNAAILAPKTLCHECLVDLANEVFSFQPRTPT